MPVLSAVKSDEMLYVEADGSMILIREEGWSETKVAEFLRVAVASCRRKAGLDQSFAI